jgi:hypothetical protein
VELREPVVSEEGRLSPSGSLLMVRLSSTRHRGGAVCSSDEAVVMIVERRDSIRQSTLIINWLDQ